MGTLKGVLLGCIVISFVQSQVLVNADRALVRCEWDRKNDNKCGITSVKSSQSGMAWVSGSSPRVKSRCDATMKNPTGDFYYVDHNDISMTSYSMKNSYVAIATTDNFITVSGKGCVRLSYLVYGMGNSLQIDTINDEGQIVRTVDLYDHPSASWRNKKFTFQNHRQTYKLVLTSKVTQAYGYGGLVSVDGLSIVEGACRDTDDNEKIQLRLENGMKEGMGTVMATYKNMKGGICRDGITQTEVDKLCQELAFEGGLLLPRTEVTGSNNMGKNTILLDELKCSGNEVDFEGCSHDGIGVHDCHPDDILAVECYNKLNVRGQWWTRLRFDNLQKGQDSIQGIPRVMDGDSWKYLCRESFDDIDAKTMCNMLRFNNGGRSSYASRPNPAYGVYRKSYHCTDRDNDFFQCTHSDNTCTDFSSVAKVTCYHRDMKLPLSINYNEVNGNMAFHSNLVNRQWTIDYRASIWEGKILLGETRDSVNGSIIAATQEVRTLPTSTYNLCLGFSVYRSSNQAGPVKVAFKAQNDYTTKSVLLYQESDSSAVGRWNRQVINIMESAGYATFTAQVGTTYNGFVAFKDIKMTRGECPEVVGNVDIDTDGDKRKDEDGDVDKDADKDTDGGYSDSDKDGGYSDSDKDGSDQDSDWDDDSNSDWDDDTTSESNEVTVDWRDDNPNNPTPTFTEFECTFNDDECTTYLDNVGQIPFRRHSGRTPSSNTGPEDGQGSAGRDGKRMYMYMEASERNPGEKARFVFKEEVNGPACLEFKYHAYGQHVGNLTVSTSDNSRGDETSGRRYVWGLSKSSSSTEHSTRPNNWMSAKMSVRNRGYLTLETTRGGRYRGEPFGDIAVDDIKVRRNRCP